MTFLIAVADDAAPKCVQRLTECLHCCASNSLRSFARGLNVGAVIVRVAPADLNHGLAKPVAIGMDDRNEALLALFAAHVV